MRELYTVGYEASRLEEFIATLISMRIEALIDIRELPLSRKKGFSKNGLAKALEDAGIKYLHFKALGDPKPGRDAARRGDFAKFRKIFGNHMKTLEAQGALRTVSTLATQSRTCLLCFERDHSECHRSIVASAISDTANLTVTHLEVKARELAK